MDSKLIRRFDYTLFKLLTSWGINIISAIFNYLDRSNKIPLVELLFIYIEYAV